MRGGLTWVALLALALLVSSTGRARAQKTPRADLECGQLIDDNSDTREDRAFEHYVRAQQLYDDGQYELSIQEFFAAYCLKPSPEPLKNIASAYLGLVNYEQAIEWFQRYVNALPEDNPDRKATANRIDRLRKVPARVSVSTQPQRAKVMLKGDQVTVEGVANSGDVLLAPDGLYVLRVELPGYEVHEQPVELRIGQPYSYSINLEQQRGTLRVTTNPGSARVFLDDKLVGVGAFVGEVAIGTHKLTVEATGRPAHTREIAIAADEILPVYVRLPAPERSGRWELIGALTTYGAIAGGTLGDAMFEQGSGGVALITLGAAGVSFAGGYLGADEGIPVGRTSYIIGGTLWGAVEGLAIGSIFSSEQNTVTPIMVAGLTVGAVFTTVTARRFDLDAGDAALLNSGGIWGSMSGLLLWGLFDSDEDLFGPFLLGGVNAGLFAGAALGWRYDFSRGHVALIDLSGLAGAVTGLALASAFPDENDMVDEDTQLHFAFGGMLVGLLTGAVLTRNMDVERAPAALSTTARRMTPMVLVTPSGRPTLGLGTSWRWD